jgi:hypothetical protein
LASAANLLASLSAMGISVPSALSRFDINRLVISLAKEPSLGGGVYVPAGYFLAKLKKRWLVIGVFSTGGFLTGCPLSGPTDGMLFILYYHNKIKYKIQQKKQKETKRNQMKPEEPENK